MLNYRDHIESSPTVMLGKPRIKGTRITVSLILKKIADGFSIEDLLNSYPHLKKEDILACISYAASVVNNEDVLPATY